jgi:hypothetical protein
MLILFSCQLNLLKDLLVGCNTPSKSLVMMWQAYLMQHCSQGPLTLPKMVTDCGAALLIKSDNAPEFKGKIGLTTFGNTRFHLNLQKPSIQMKTIVNIMEELSRQQSFIF